MRIARRLKDVGLSIDGKTSFPHRSSAMQNTHVGQSTPIVPEDSIDSDEEGAWIYADEDVMGLDGEPRARPAPITLACYWEISRVPWRC